ncbi:ras-like protein family member 10B, partial [Oratosquilla oratoria]|uniref:ras-like protein family member 10B n=1 Tax=Oratosquilla oratoria TaxID=337810 RepID=UPI003F7765C9
RSPQPFRNAQPSGQQRPRRRHGQSHASGGVPRVLRPGDTTPAIPSPSAVVVCECDPSTCEKGNVGCRGGGGVCRTRSTSIGCCPPPSSSSGTHHQHQPQHQHHQQATTVTSPTGNQHQQHPHHLLQERNSLASVGCQPSPQPTDLLAFNGHSVQPPLSQQVKVVVLGASGVGKTSIIKQFVDNEFPAEHVATALRTTYCPSVIVNDRVYQLKIADLPPIKSFPVNSFAEWAEYRFYGLRSATAYVFVFDLTNPDSFSHVKTLREQLYESRDMRENAVLVIGNKRDLMGASEGMHRERRDIASTVRKHWKASYIEVSAKHNWHVVAAFRELLLALEEARASAANQKHHPNLQELHEAIEHSKCTIL